MSREHSGCAHVTEAGWRHSMAAALVFQMGRAKVGRLGAKLGNLFEVDGEPFTDCDYDGS
jgi:hypothetical protein